ELGPGPPGASVLFAFGVSSTDLIGGESTRATVSTVMLAPASGGTVTLTSGDPSVVQVPPAISIPAGNSASSFPITTSAVSLGTAFGVHACARRVTRTL